ncbi:MAG: hypothetical protein QXP10_04540 [Sulfolobales archaeon]
MFILLKALGGDGSIAPSHPRLKLDVSSVPLGSTATREPIQTPGSAWTRWKSLDTAMNENELIVVSIQGQTVKVYEPNAHIIDLAKLYSLSKPCVGR